MFILLLPALPAPAAETEQPAETSAVVDSAASTPATAASLSVELLESRIKEAESNGSLTEEGRTKLIEQYRGALGALAQAKAFEAKAAEFRASIDSAPREAASIRAEIESSRKTKPEPAAALPTDADLKQIERLLALEQAESAAVDTQIAELDKLLDEDEQQPGQMRTRLAEATQALEAVDADLQTEPPDGASSTERQAREWFLRARRDALRAELLMLDQQILSADERRELWSARRDQKLLQQKRLRDRRATLENEADRLRYLDAQRVSDETAAAARETADAHPQVKALAEQNRALSEDITAATQALDQLDEREAKLKQDGQRVEQDFRSARQRLDAAGLSRALGQVLIDQRSQLPDLRTLRKEAETRADIIAELTLDQIRHRDERRRLADMDGYLDQALAGIEDAEQAGIRDELRQQAERRPDLLKRALDVEESYRNALSELDVTASRLIEAVEGYDNFLAERLLWVRSNPPLIEQSFSPLPAAIYWLISPARWLKVADVIRYEAVRSPVFWIGLLVVVVLVWRGSAIRRAIRARADNLRRVSTDRFVYTLEALGLTLLAATPWPLLLLLFGLELAGSFEPAAFPKAIGQALIAVAPALYYLRAFRLLCMPGGVADRHFRWHTDVLQLLRRTFAWAASLLLPIGFVATAIHNQANPDYTGTLGRLSLVAFELGLAVFTATLMHHSRGVFRHMLAENPTGWASRLRGVWFGLLVAVPLALALITLIGYQYTSGTLLESLVSELWLVLGLVVAHQLIVRWLMVTRRSLALQAALDRRAQSEALREAERETGRDGEPMSVETLAAPDDGVDLASLDAQTRRLLNTLVVIAATVGIWLIWSDVLPALNLFERVTLWSYSGAIDGVEQQIPVTLADIGMILVIVLVALAAGKNLPALLEILLLKNTAVSAGSRYTIITLMGYSITAIGTLFVFSTLGLTWGEVQWLIAALSVGIGFGLQEIVANFISGLIILFERPVRVGDIVTIGETTGVVTRIEIRATTIRNWDKQELLVPNKEFITGRLLNWTLTDQVNRVVITVGAEYGCDTRMALQLLRDAAAENPRVLTDPAPLVNFEGFDDNSLRLVLRCYLDSLEYRLAVTGELHQAIDDKFRAAGIGIAFPQRDIHLRTSEPLEVRLRRTDRPAPDG
ncbi:MAG: mechanosensitive ion channel domain-containing protein [Thiohalocapsa sp.]